MFYNSKRHDKDGNYRSPFNVSMGLRGFADDKKQNKEDLAINSIAEFDSEDNVIDFLEFLKQKRDKELN